MDEEAIDDLIEQWHDGAGEGQELHEWLGLSWAEYCSWTETGRKPAGW